MDRAHLDLQFALNFLGMEFEEVNANEEYKLCEVGGDGGAVVVESIKMR